MSEINPIKTLLSKIDDKEFFHKIDELFDEYTETKIKRDVIILAEPKEIKKYLDLLEIQITVRREQISKQRENYREIVDSLNYLVKKKKIEISELENRFEEILGLTLEEEIRRFNFENFNLDEPIFDNEFQHNIICSHKTFIKISNGIIRYYIEVYSDESFFINEFKKIDKFERLIVSLMPPSAKSPIDELKNEWKETFDVDSIDVFGTRELLISYFGFDCEHTQSNIRMTIEDKLLQMNKDDSIKYLKTILLLISRELEYFNTAMIEAQDKAKQYESIKHDHHDYYNFWHNALLKSSSAKNTISNLENQKQYYEDKLNQFQPKETPPMETLKQPESELPERKGKKQAAPIEVEKITWKGSQTQLVAFFESLINQKYIDDENIHSLVSKHFQDKNGKPFNNKTLAQTKQNYLATKKPKNKDKIESSVSNLKNK